MVPFLRKPTAIERKERGVPQLPHVTGLLWYYAGWRVARIHPVSDQDERYAAGERMSTRMIIWSGAALLPIVEKLLKIPIYG
jgi:hypothetical protein